MPAQPHTSILLRCRTDRRDVGRRARRWAAHAAARLAGKPASKDLANVLRRNSFTLVRKSSVLDILDTTVFLAIVEIFAALGEPLGYMPTCGGAEYVVFRKRGGEILLVGDATHGCELPRTTAFGDYDALRAGRGEAGGGGGGDPMMTQLEAHVEGLCGDARVQGGGERGVV